MKRKFITIVSVIAIIACMFGLFACNSISSEHDGMYYMYTNGTYVKSAYIKLNGNEYEDASGDSGKITIDGTSITFNSSNDGSMSGQISNGVIAISQSTMGMTITVYYCQDGKTPDDFNKPSDNPNTGNGDNPGGDNPDNPSGENRTVTFDANGGYTTTVTMQFKSGATMQNLPTPTRTGYNFVSWADDKGNAYNSATAMPDKNITLIAQWVKKQSQYSDTYVSLSPATEGTKNIMTQFEYGSYVDKMLYVELTSDDLGGPTKVGIQNNFTLTTVSDMKYSIKTGYSWTWYEGNFNTPNGAQRFTLNYGSNFQFVTIGDGSGVVLQTYLVDIYVKQDYYVNLYSDIDSMFPYDSVRVIDGDYFSAVNHTKQVCDFVFDKHVYKVPIDDRYLFEYEYNKPVKEDWDLYQTFKAKKMTPELNGGTLDGEITVTPYSKAQTLPVPEKEGYDFIGWKLGDKYFTDIEGNSGVNYLNSTNGNQTLTASFEPKHFYWYNDGDELKTAVATLSISYKDNAKTEINKINYTYNGTTLDNSNSFVSGESATVTAQKDGYTFVGWYNGNIELSKNTSYTFTVPQSEFTYTRKWTYYTLTTDRNITSGGSVTNYNAQKVTAGDRVTITANTYSGYTFLGWYNGETQLTDKLSYTFTMPDANITYTAKWTNCPVTFEKNITSAGSIDVPSATSIGQSITVTAHTNNGYTWLGWYNGNALLTADASYTFTLTNSTATYTAKWAEYKLTTATNDSNAGSVTNYSNRRITAGQSVTITATTNNGYTFVGWYDGVRELTKELNYTFTMPTANVAYTAKWIKVTVASDNSVAGSVTTFNGKYKVGESVTVTATTNNGYTFVGWYDGATRKTTELSYSFAMPSESVTYTAKWIKVTVASDNNSAGSVTALNGKYKAGESVTVTATTNNGYTFVGWYDGATRKTTELSYSFAMPSESVTYTAKWIRVTIERSDASAGTVSSLNGKYIVGDNVTVMATTNNGYTFVGWYEGATIKSTDESYTFTMPSNNTTYVAKWTYYTLTIQSADPNAGSVTSYYEQKITARQLITLKATPNIGHTFIGWYNGLQEISKELNFDFSMPLSNMTIVARFEQDVALNNFYYTSTATTLTITGIKDKTISEINVPNYVTQINQGAFSGCSNLDNISLPFVGENATATNASSSTLFGYIFGTSSYTGGTSTKQYYSSSGYSTYYISSSLKSVTITGGNILYGAFYGCSGLTSIEIPNSVTSIGSSAFRGCSGLTSLEIPNSVTSIWSGAFTDCSCLTIYCEAANRPIGWSSDWNWSSVWNSSSCPVVWDCKNNDKDQDGYAYEVLDRLRYRLIDGIATVVLSSNIDKSIIIPSSIVHQNKIYSVTSIGDNAFRGCSSLTSIEIPNSVTSIGDMAFYNCSSLMSIEIPSSVTSIGNNAFYDCSSLARIVVEGGNQWYCSKNNCLIEIISNALVKGCKNSIIPKDGSVTSIGDYAFSGCSSLTSIEIPNSVTSIGYYAFSGCSSLTSIEIPNSVTSIRSGAFRGCSSLTSIEIPNSVTSIGSSAFNNCSSLTSITIPSSVTSIGSSVFYNCSSLTSIEIPNGVTYIDDSAFYNCSSLTSIEIPNGLRTIVSYAFRGCSSLISIKFNGTQLQWKAIIKDSSWNYDTGSYTVICTDGTLTKSES